MTLLRSPIHSPIRSPIYSPLVGKWGNADPLGAWLLNATYADYDASKLDRMFQETTGQTPVAASADKVGLWFDGSQFGNKTFAQFLAGQTELLTPGSWIMSTTGGTASATESPAGTLNVAGDGTNSGRGDQSFATVSGRRYWLSVAVGGANPALAVSIGTTQGATNLGSPTFSGAGVKTYTFSAAGATTWIRFARTGPGSGTASAISMKEAQVNTAFNGTSTQRLNLLISGSRYSLTADGTDDNLLSTYLAGVGANSILIDTDVPASLAATQVIAGMSGSATARLSIGINTSGQLCAGVGSDANTIIIGTTDWRGTRLIAALSADGSTVKLLSATGEEYSAAQNGSPTTTIPARLAANNNNGTASSFYGGGIARAIIAQKALDLATFNAIRAQLLAT